MRYTDNNDQTFPRDDINAPDLYIPSKSIM